MVNRREVLKAGVAATAATSIVAGVEPLFAFAPDAVAKVTGAGWKPVVFTPEQNETVVLLSDLIIPATDTPGAKAANVNRYIDLLLSLGPADERERFLSGLAWFQSYAAKPNGTPFLKQPAAMQIALLEKLDGGENSSETAQGFQFFRMMKSLTARMYYQTEVGFKELNKHGVPGGFGCKHNGHKA